MQFILSDKVKNKIKYYDIETVLTIKNPKILADILNRGKDDLVSRWAALNPNCPPHALAEVLKRGKNDLVSQNVADNPNCPPNTLVEVLKRGNDDEVSQFAADNRNCPLKAKILWMMQIGKIKKEDPNKHFIQYINQNENNVDEDLQKLKNLIGE